MTINSKIKIIISLLLVYTNLPAQLIIVERLSPKQKIEKIQNDIVIPTITPPTIATQDTDQDGVKDSEDKCRTTPKSFVVDTNGCEVSFTLWIHYISQSTKIISESDSEINKLVRFLKFSPLYKAELRGYTDSIGEADENLKVTQKRVDIFKQRLVAEGIKAYRLKAMGYGETNPLENNMYEEGRKKNQRIEIFFFKDKK